MPTRSKSNIRLSSAVQRYLDRIRNEKQAPSSQYTAMHALSRFQKTVGSKRDPDPWVHLISPAMTEEYFFGKGGISEGVKSITLNRYRSVLVQFFRYCEDLRWTDSSPMLGIRPARPDMPVKRLMLSASEMVEMMKQTGNPIERIGCALGMNTGLRSNDIRHLTVFDANLSSGEIQTEIRKTRQLDAKPITMELEAELVRWLEIYAHILGLPNRSYLPNHYLLVPSYRNQAPAEHLDWGVMVRPEQLHTKPWHLVQRPLARIGYPTKGEGFHTLRRSSARAFFESLRASGAGGDHALMIVKTYLNHASVTQTEIYLGLSHERVMRDALLKGQSFIPALASSEGTHEGAHSFGTRDHEEVREASRPAGRGGGDPVA